MKTSKKTQKYFGLKVQVPQRDDPEDFLHLHIGRCFYV
jgi:hypothetical protein